MESSVTPPLAVPTGEPGVRDPKLIYDATRIAQAANALFKRLPPDHPLAGQAFALAELAGQIETVVRTSSLPSSAPERQPE